MPSPLDHALVQLRRRRVLLVPAEADAGSDGRKRYPVRLTRSLLSRVPSSPALRDALVAAPAGTAVFGGHAWLAPDERPRLTLDGLGGIWRLALPGRRGTFATLREIRTRRDLAFRPEVVFLDLGLPGIDGYELARRLREHPDLRHARLAALSGYGQEADRNRTKAAGFDAHLVKPVSYADLIPVLALSETDSQ